MNNTTTEQQQNGYRGMQEVISQESQMQTNNNNNQRQRMKWSKELNKDIIRCYYYTILKSPNEPYRKAFYNIWTTKHPELRLTEQRICDQHRTIMKKVNTRENIRGNWLTELDITEIRNNIMNEINQSTTAENENTLQHETRTEHQQIYEQNNQHIEEQNIINININETEENTYHQEIRNTLINKFAQSTMTQFENRYNFKKPKKKSLKTLEKSIREINKVIETTPLISNDIDDVNKLNNLIYAAALTAIENAGLQNECLKRNRTNNNKKTNWTHNINSRINQLRTDINKINQMTIQNPSSKIKRNTNSMKNKYNINNEEKRTSTLETLKQRLIVLNNRLSRFLKRRKQYQQNADFINQPSKLYDQLRGNQIVITEPPTKENIESFWGPIYKTQKQFNKDAKWLKEYETSINYEEATYRNITKEDFTKSTSSFANWKSPGIDKLHNFWWKSLSSIHQRASEILNDIIRKPEDAPEWLTMGRTSLIAKKPPTTDSSNYRPITCLPVIYKIITNIITSRMNEHINRNNIIPTEQKGNANNTSGTIDQLIINKMVMETAKRRNVNISTAWIDYRKAFDSIPHDWIIHLLKIMKFDETTIKFFETTMKKWKTSLTLTHENGSITTDNFEIKTGIFQGDSASPLLFVLSLVPLSWLLKRSNLGFRITRTDIISHLLFMDDLKLYASNDKQLENLINIVETFSNDIQMSFGIEKCNKLTVIRGKIRKSNNITLNNGDEIKSLNITGYYKYLGIREAQTTDKDAKLKIKKEYFTRLKMIMKSELTSKHTIDAINSYAVPVISYGFQILDWTITDLETIDRDTRKMLQNYHLMHIQSNVGRLYIPRKDGGRGLISVTDHFRNSIINFSSHLTRTEERFLQITSEWQHQRGPKSIHLMSRLFCREININLDNINTESKQERKRQIKSKRNEKYINILKQKNLHGQYFNILDEPHIDKATSIKWLTSATLKKSTESTICALQEQAVTTNYTRKHIFKTTNCDLCRVCRADKETVQHIISGCPALAPTKYLKRHDDVCKYVHIQLLKEFGIDTSHKWYEHNPNSVEENENVKILWNFPIQTDHTIPHNKPDIILINKQTKEANIIDIAIPNDNNIARKRLEKINIYTDLSVEIKTLWNLNKVKITPIIIGALGLIYNELENDINKISLNKNKIDIGELQKITLLGTAHIARSFNHQVA